MPNYEVRQTKNSAWFPLIGFIVFVILAALSFFVAPNVAQFLTTETWTLGVTRVLPMRFPDTWTDIQIRLAAAAGLFMVLFALATIVMLTIMGSPMSDTDISLKEIRETKKAQMGGRRRHR
jgi:Trk-type K+ transport system membrane component